MIYQGSSFRVRPRLIYDSHPLHVGANALDNNFGAGEVFNGQAPIFGDRPDAAYPLIYRCRCHTKLRGKRPLASENFAGFFDSVHSLHGIAMLTGCQAMLPPQWIALLHGK